MAKTPPKKTAAKKPLHKAAGGFVSPKPMSQPPASTGPRRPAGLPRTGGGLPPQGGFGGGAPAGGAPKNGGIVPPRTGGGGQMSRPAVQPQRPAGRRPAGNGKFGAGF